MWNAGQTAKVVQFAKSKAEELNSKLSKEPEATTSEASTPYPTSKSLFTAYNAHASTLKEKLKNIKSVSKTQTDFHANSNDEDV